MEIFDNKTNKLVSIIIPAFNVENYIEQCLKSVLAQTYSPIEIIVVDDGSKDNTWKYIEMAMKNDSRIRGFHRDNSGVSATRNFALEQAGGEYICFVDGDDYVAADMVATLVENIEVDSSDWVNCQYHRVDDAGNFLEEYDFLQGNIKTGTPSKKLDLILNPLIDYQLGYEVWNKLFKASIIKEHNISFIKECHIGEDLAFNICYAFFAKSLSSICNRPYYYRVRDNSAMGSVASVEKNFREHLVFVKGIQPYFEVAFVDYDKEQYYRLFFKLMFHASHGYTAKETAEAAITANDSFYVKWLDISLKHKSEFKEFLGEHQAKLYYRCGLYIKTKLKKDIIGEINLGVYNVYRKLRKQPAIGEWRV